MNDDEIKQILNAFSSLPKISNRWPAILIYWINNADGFIETMTLDEDKQTTAQFLIDKLTQLLKTLPNNTTDAELASLIARDFELLFLRAQFGSTFWNSTKESFRDFCNGRTPNQLVIDIPHEQPERVAAWLRTFIE